MGRRVGLSGSGRLAGADVGDIALTPLCVHLAVVAVRPTVEVIRRDFVATLGLRSEYGVQDVLAGHLVPPAMKSATLMMSTPNGTARAMPSSVLRKVSILILSSVRGFGFVSPRLFHCLLRAASHHVVGCLSLCVCPSWSPGLPALLIVEEMMCALFSALPLSSPSSPCLMVVQPRDAQVDVDGTAAPDGT